MRLFAAVRLDPAAEEALAATLAGVGDPPGGPRWSARDHWHITVVFLGEVDQMRVPELRRRFAAVAGGQRAFSIRLDGVGTFPARGRPSVLWAGLAGEVTELAALARDARRAARRVGVSRPERRPYRPHFTLGRWRAGDDASRAVVIELGGLRGPDFRCDRMALVRSFTGPDPRYEPLDSWKLGGT